ncbi:hypothetical protein FIV42_28895 [Persicimonas caeni]|uniref:Acyloxyacyl hydrolase n=1 Tax=Persicimonas caeni TaxID=2292766 RepID=A0A4Y6Q1Z2_PERCE|nr:hypothetical protein [Persicimonas caeni]QDG54618.1 hypothetical protein FIV42_28895 [Persicimonas caeni]QED35839.1 hypothetical protein FRD00_28890 [Persicimonas caeni]
MHPTINEGRDVKYSSSRMVVALLSACAISSANLATAAAETPEAPAPSWLSVDALIGVSVGQSNVREGQDSSVRADLRSPAFDRPSYWSVSYLFVPKATFGEFEFAASLLLEQWMSDQPNAEAAFELGETLLHARWKGYEAPEAGFSASPAATFVLPTSNLHERSRLWVGAELGVDLTQRLHERVRLGANVSYRQNFHNTPATATEPMARAFYW